MKINKKKLNIFGMKINSFTYQPYVMERETFQAERSLRPVLGKQTLTPKSMELVAEFRSKLDISNFMAELMSHDENILDIDDGYIYRCYLLSSKNPVSEYWQGWYRVSISFAVIQEGHRRILHLKNAKNIVNVAGNWTTECMYVITPKINLQTLKVAGYEIRNLYKGRTVYLDGESKRIYTATEPNKYNDCKLKNNEFPTLRPGNQVIEMSSADAKVQLQYTPIYV